MPAGRPSKYDPKYCEQLIKHMQQGLSFESFAANVPCCFDTLHEWVKVHPEFSEAKRIGKSLELKWWESILGGGASGKLKNFSAAATIFALKNKAPKLWRDRKEVEATIDTSMGKLSSMINDPVLGDAALKLAEAIALQDDEES
jgi:hypothetical protein